MKATKEHTYLGYSILPCAYAQSKRWYCYRDIWAEQQCRQFDTLKEAREYISEQVAFEEEEAQLKAAQDEDENEYWNTVLANKKRILG